MGRYIANARKASRSRTCDRSRPTTIRPPCPAPCRAPECPGQRPFAAQGAERATLHATEHFGRLRPRQHYRYAYRPFRTNYFIQQRQVNFQYFFVKKQKRAERLVLCRRRNLATSCKIGEERLNLGGTELARWSIAVVLYEPLDPLNISNFGAITIMIGTKYISSLFHESLRHSTIRPLSHSKYHPLYQAYIGPPPTQPHANLPFSYSYS